MYRGKRNATNNNIHPTKTKSAKHTEDNDSNIPVNVLSTWRLHVARMYGYTVSAHEQHVRRTLTLTHTISAYSVSGNVRVRILICQGGHSPGKPGKVREFQSGPEKVRENGKSQGNIYYLGL